MLKFTVKNNKQRKNSNPKEFLLLCWKVIKLLLVNKKYQKTNNSLAYIRRYFSYIVYLSSTTKQTLPLSKIRNVCFLSGRTRSIYRMFKLSRLKVKELAQHAQFTGMSKLSW